MARFPNGYGVHTALDVSLEERRALRITRLCFKYFVLTWIKKYSRQHVGTPHLIPLNDRAILRGFVKRLKLVDNPLNNVINTAAASKRGAARVINLYNRAFDPDALEDKGVQKDEKVLLSVTISKADYRRQMKWAQTEFIELGLSQEMISHITAWLEAQ